MRVEKNFVQLKKNQTIKALQVTQKSLSNVLLVNETNPELQHFPD